jgi:pilus assembly protein CpaB
MATTWPARSASRSNNRRILIVALVFGLLSAFLVWRVLSSSSSGSVSSNMVPVVVARQDIAARTVIAESLLTVKQIPSSLRLATAYTDPKTLLNKVAKSQISAGEQIVAARVAADPREVGFTGTVPPGMRAVSIQVSEVVDIGGLIQPGDTVDVVGVFQVWDSINGADTFGKPEWDKPKHLVTSTLVQSATVLAIAQSSDSGASQPSSGKVSAGKAQADAKTVTLAVSPQDAERLALADNAGTLRLSAHRFNETGGQPINCVQNSGQSLIQAQGLVCNSPLPAAVASPQPAATPEPAASPAASPAPSH